MSNDDQVRPVFLPAGVAEPDKRVGYVADTNGGIEALDLLNGKLYWRADVTARPVIVFENTLVALRPAEDKASDLQVVVLDRSNEGNMMLESDLLVFPDWVTATTEPNQFFGYEVRIDRTELKLVWEAHARYRGGAPPPGYVLAQANRDAAGVSRINLNTGEVTMLPPENEIEIGLPEAYQQESLFSYQMGASSSWHTKPWAVDHRFAVIAGEVFDDQQTLKLQMWDAATGKTEQSISLVTGHALISYVTPDGRYLFIHSELTTGTPPDYKRPWWLFSVVAGKRLGVLNYEQDTKEACVLNSHVYYLVENPPPASRTGGELVQTKMKALDIVSGALLWERRLSDRVAKRRPALRQ